MSTLRKACIALTAIVVAGMFACNTARAQMTVIGNWEQFDTNSPPGGGNFNSDGWIDWHGSTGTDADNQTANSGHGIPITDTQFTTGNPNSGAPNPNDNRPRWSASTTTGVTLGSQSAQLRAAGYQQSLAIKLEYTTGDLTAFFANKAFALDVTYPSFTAAQNANGGFQQVYQYFLNGPGLGFTATTPNPVPTTNVGFAPNTASNATTYTLRIGYGNLLSSFSSQSYAEMIFATNSDTTTDANGQYNHGVFYFDNARLYTPGDMNNDGHVDAKDIPAMELALTDPTAYKNTYWASNANYTDADRILIGDMQGADPNLGTPPNGINMIGDGVFNGADLQYLINYLKDGVGSASAVPEPAALTLLGLAGPVLWWMARRKRNAT